MSALSKEIGRLLQHGLVDKGMSRRAVGDVVGLSQTMVNDIFRGERAPTTDQLEDICDELGLDRGPGCDAGTWRRRRVGSAGGSRVERSRWLALHCRRVVGRYARPSSSGSRVGWRDWQPAEWVNLRTYSGLPRQIEAVVTHKKAPPSSVEGGGVARRGVGGGLCECAVGDE